MDRKADALRQVRWVTLADLAGRNAVVCASDPRSRRVDHEVMVEKVSPNGLHAFLRPVAADGSLWFGYWVGVKQYQVVRVVNLESRKAGEDGVGQRSGEDAKKTCNLQLAT